MFGSGRLSRDDTLSEGLFGYLKGPLHPCPPKSLSRGRRLFLTVVVPVILQLEVEGASQALHDSGVDALQPGAVSVQLGVHQAEGPFQHFSKSKKFTR